MSAHDTCKRGHDNWYIRPSGPRAGGRFCRSCNTAARARSRRSSTRNPELCWNQLHPRTPGSCPPCAEAYLVRKRAREATRRTRENRYWLWVDDAAEYRFMREMLGLTPREIGDKFGIRWESFQRTLHRRLGRSSGW